MSLSIEEVNEILELIKHYKQFDDGVSIKTVRILERMSVEYDFSIRALMGSVGAIYSAQETLLSIKNSDHALLPFARDMYKILQRVPGEALLPSREVSDLEPLITATLKRIQENV